MYRKKNLNLCQGKRTLEENFRQTLANYLQIRDFLELSEISNLERHFEFSHHFLPHRRKRKQSDRIEKL